MNSLQHLTISILIGSISTTLTGQTLTLQILAPWIIGGVLVDLDHLFTYSAKDKTISLKKLARFIFDDYKFNNQHFFIFHTIEFTLFVSFIVIKTNLTWHYLAAYLLHLACDGLRQRRLRKNYLWLKKWSLCLNFLK